MKKNRRLIHVWAGIPLKDEEMGEVPVKVRLTNIGDEMLAMCGQLKPDEVRSVEVEAMVDMGAVRCVLPDRIRLQLGLKTLSHSWIASTAGWCRTRPIRTQSSCR